MFDHVVFKSRMECLAGRAKIYQVKSINSFFAQRGKIANLFKAFTGVNRPAEEILNREKMTVESKIYKEYESSKYSAL